MGAQAGDIAVGFSKPCANPLERLMADSLDAIDLKALAAFDDIIDVRSPAEFAIDHVPGAINLPVLSNQQRAEVGTVYVKLGW